MAKTPLGKTIQLGFVVHDLRQAMRRYETMLSLNAWTLYTLEPPLLQERQYYGLPGTFSMRVALTTDPNGLMYELIEPLTGPSIYHDFLATQGEGLHHIAYECPEGLEATLKFFQNDGIEPSMEGFWGEIHFMYLATENKLGTCVEVWEMPDNYVLPEAARIDSL